MPTANSGWPPGDTQNIQHVTIMNWWEKMNLFAGYTEMKVYCRPSQYYYFTSFFLFILFKAGTKYTKIKKSTWKGIQSVQKFLVLFIIFMYADLCNSCRCAAVIACSHLERDWSVQPLEWKLRRSSVDVKKAKLLGVTSEKSACFHFANRGNSHKPTSHLNLIRHLRLSWVKSEPF